MKGLIADVFQQLLKGLCIGEEFIIGVLNGEGDGDDAEDEDKEEQSREAATKGVHCG
jgi:hypothetical protein